MRKAAAVLLSTAVGVMAVAPAVAQAAVQQPAQTETVQLVLPQPTGPQRIGSVSLHLVDRSRADPWMPGEPAREIMVQIWYPARDVRSHPRVPWVSPALAERINPPGSALILPVSHAYAAAPAAHGRRPVVLYSPGFGIERTASTALVEELASHGYIVVTIDHTYDSPLVEFPGGRLAENALPQPTDPADELRIIATALAARVADTRFTLDQLVAVSRGQNPDAAGRPLPPGLAAALDLSRVAMFGHSIGGATAAQTMYEDRRVLAGINMDGTVSGAVVAAGLDRPFLLLGSQAHGSGEDDSWAALWANLRGPRLELQLDGSGHLSFTDYQVLLPQAGTPAEAMIPDFGTIDGERSIAVQRAYLRAFLDRHLRHRGSRLLMGPSAHFAEMRFMR